MNKLSDKELDNLFRDSFLDLEKELPLNSSWTSISKKVTVKNFMKFSFSSFNIFYLLIASSVVISGTAIYFINQPLKEKNNLLPSQKSILTDDTVNTKSKKEDPPQEKISSSKGIISNKNKNKESKKESPSSNENKIIETPTTDSSFNNHIPLDPKEANNLNTMKEESPKPKKIITVIKRDTIIVKDTINVNRRRK